MQPIGLQYRGDRLHSDSCRRVCGRVHRDLPTKADGSRLWARILVFLYILMMTPTSFFTVLADTCQMPGGHYEGVVLKMCIV